MGLRVYSYLRFIRCEPVADLRGARGTRAPMGVQILSISCSFWEILAKSYVGAPPPGSWHPSSGKSWIRHCEPLWELFSPRNREKWVENPLLNFSVHAKLDQNNKCECTVQPISLRNRGCKWILTVLAPLHVTWDAIWLNVNLIGGSCARHLTLPGLQFWLQIPPLTN